jgi:hypothetical protein
MTPAAHVCPADHVGKERRAEPVEFTEGVIFAVERETDRRQYGRDLGDRSRPRRPHRVADLVPDGPHPAAHALVARDAPDARRRWVSADVRGHHVWHLGVPAASPGHSEVAALRRHPVPPFDWPEAEAGCRNLRLIHDRFRGSHVSGATGDGLGDPSMACRGRRSARVSGRSASSSAVRVVGIGMTTARDGPAMPPKLSHVPGRLDPR